jgi:hypothetical protein
MDNTHTTLRRMVGTAGLLPFALAVFVHVVRPSQPAAREAADRPALAFHQYLVDLGRIQPSSEERAIFVFRNRGSQAVHITDVKPSCGCLEPHVSSRMIEPGGEGHIVLRMQPANETPGPKEFHVDLKYTDPQPRDVRLAFKVEIPEQGLSVRPRALLVYQNADTAISKQIVVSDTRPTPARVEQVSVSNPIIQVALGDVHTTASGAIEQTVEVNVEAGVPAGRHEAVVTIHTSDPHAPVLRVPLRIDSRPATAEVEQP